VATLIGLAVGGGVSAAAEPAVRPSVDGGYLFATSGEAGMHGLAIGGTYPIAGRFEAAGELGLQWGGYAGADLGATSLLLGARRGFGSWRAVPFAQLRAGFVRDSASVEGGPSSGATHPLVALGGGVEFPVRDHWHVRGLLDAGFVSADGEWDAELRFSVGVAYRVASGAPAPKRKR
jgi:hypothetical protein